MEFLRFGSSIPGSYWGCCACCIIQNFNFDPDTAASIQLCYGDSGAPIVRGSSSVFAGPTYRDIFKQRMRIGTFDTREMPDHAFFAILTQNQIAGATGKKWLEILKAEGFEFIRTVDNSVYTGASVADENAKVDHSSKPNYIFGMFRNIGTGRIVDQFTPPKEWTDLPSVITEPWQLMAKTDMKAMQRTQMAYHYAEWQFKPKPFLTEEQLEEMKVTVTYAGVRNKFPQQPKAARVEAQKKATKASPATKAPIAFAA